MSLLLEALKKAELAKQGKQPDATDSLLAAEIQFEPSPQAGAAEPKGQNFITRGELPNISHTLEILSEDLPSMSAKRDADEAAAEPVAAQPSRVSPPPYRPARAPAPEPEMESVPPSTTASMDSDGAAERDAARQLFEAKEVEYHPKRNFYITLGVLITVAAGYGGYVWWELQPKSAYSAAALQAAAKSARTAPIARAPEAAQPPPPAAASSPSPAAAASSPSPRATASGPQLPTAPQSGPPPVATKAAAPRAAEAAKPLPAQPRTVFAKRPAAATGPAVAAQAPGRARPPTRAAARTQREPIAIKAPALEVDPLVARGYDAYQRSDLAGAHDAYELALRRDPLNRDALLGMAAIAVRERRFEGAQAHYIRLIELDPRDVHAAAGLLALRGQVSPTQSESRLKTLIAANPDVAELYFALGNQYARQARWAEAQAAYFKAYAGDLENADFAVNLAISLDQMRQEARALEYYRRAMALAVNRPVSFDLNQIHTRIQELERR